MAVNATKQVASSTANPIVSATRTTFISPRARSRRRFRELSNLRLSKGGLHLRVSPLRMRLGTDSKLQRQQTTCIDLAQPYS